MTRVMRSVPALLLAGLMAANLAAGLGREARAQTPAAEIHRVQGTTYVPSFDRKRPIFILVLGSDARPGEKVNRLHADSIHIVAVNPREGGGTIVGFPRDSWVTLPGRGETRINDAMVYGGPKLAVETVESITNIPIDYYMLTSFPGLVKMVKRVGGLPITIPYRMQDESSGANFKPGKTRLNGDEALAFARDRHSTPGGDFGRSENQGRLMIAALTKLRKTSENGPTVLLRWIEAGLANMETDLSLVEVFDLAATATQIDPENVKNVVVPGAPTMINDASVVLISGAAQEIYDDVRDDGLLNG
ncbi:MAG TPA: LCP family protein [Actinomycetota bacterium]